MRSGRPLARQLLYYGVAFGTDLQIYEIDLRIETSGRSWVVSGQVFGGAAEGGQAKLHSDTSRTLATLNEQSEFILSPVDAGIYSLTLSLANVDVEVSELRIGV
jgi:hypothetical protein